MSGELSFGEWLKRRRGAMGLTQEALARQVGCSTIALRKIEAEERRPSGQIAERLADCLRIEAQHKDGFVRFARGEISAGPGLPAPLGWGRAAPTVRRQGGIPRYLTTFIGREEEAARIVELIQREDVRLVTLTGPPGIGKTRLAVRVAGELQGTGLFAGGIVYVSLAEVDEPHRFLTAIAQSVGLEDPRSANLVQRLASAVGGEARLLVLDNFEHLTEAAPGLAELLRAAPSLRALVTSRAPLRVEGETLFQVPALSVPELEGLPATETLRRFPAIRLFEDRARMARADFVVTADTAPAVTAICARLDGLPLAIELAAARVDLLPLPDLLERLGGKFVLHIEGLRGRPARHRSMNDAVGWSYELLGQAEQRAFRFMSAFLGGFTLEAAQAVCAASDAASGPADSTSLDALKLTTALVEKGLLVPGEGPAGEARFNMLAVIREYALARLDDAGESDAAGRKHAAFFRAFVEASEPKLLGPDQVAWLDRLAADLPNLRAALKWSLAEHVESGLALAGGMWRFWLVRSDVSEGREWLERLLAGSFDLEKGPTKLRVKAGTIAAHLAMVQGDSARARSLAEESLAFAREMDDSQLYAFSLAVAGDVAHKINELERGEKLLREALNIFRQEGPAWGMAFCLSCLSVLAVIQDDLRGAVSYREESLELGRRLGDTWGMVEALGQLGGMARMEGNYAGARAFHEEQLGLARVLGSKSGIGLALNLLAWAAREEGDFERAKELYQESLALSRETGNKWRVAGVLNGMGVVAWRLGDLQKARSLLRESLALRLEIGNAQWIAFGHQNLGDVYGSEGKWDEAVNAYREALSVLRRVNALKSDVAEVIRRLGAVAIARSKVELATRLLGAAEKLRETAGAGLPPLDRADHERYVADVRGKLGSAVFEAAWAEGRRMSLEEAIDCGFDV